MKLFENAKFTLLPFEKYRPFADFPAETPAVSERKKRQLIRKAEEYTAHEIPLLPASLYMDFARTGNRCNYQTPYYERRSQLCALLLGEYAEGNGRFIERIADLVWAICEETSWVIPAHNVDNACRLLAKPLPDAYGEEIVAIDLFSATTAAELAWTVWLLGEKISEKVSVQIIERINFELERRIVRPYLKYTMRWITEFVNNWCPWIVQNVLTVTALTVRDDAVRTAVVKRSLEFLDVFTATYDDDGGCDEGPSYWNAAGAAWFDALEQLYDMSGGSIDVFGTDFCRRIGEYPVDMNIRDDLYTSFADCHQRITLSPEQIYRFGVRTGSAKMRSFGAQRVSGDAESGGNGYFMYRYIKNLFQKVSAEPRSVPDKNVFYDGLQVAVMRAGDFFVACKGGHNNESHNHNDIGNLVVYRRGEPFLIDVGVDTYTADTFNQNRYKIWTMQSQWHNLPTVGGAMQHEGAEFKADRFEFDAAAARAVISFAGAYEKSAGLKKYRREVCAAEKKITIRDELECAAAEEVNWHFMLTDEPEKLENGFFLNGNSLTASEACEVKIESRELPAGETLNKAWKRDRLWRVTLTPEKRKIYSLIFTIKA